MDRPVFMDVRVRMVVFVRMSMFGSDHGRHQIAVEHAFRPQQSVCNPANRRALALHDHDLEAVMLVNMNMHAAYDLMAMRMLDVIKFVAQIARVMIEHHRERRKDLGIRLLDVLLHQGASNQIPHCLGAVFGSAASLNILV